MVPREINNNVFAKVRGIIRENYDVFAGGLSWTYRLICFQKNQICGMINDNEYFRLLFYWH